MTDKMPCHITDEWVYNPDEDMEDDEIVMNGEEE